MSNELAVIVQESGLESTKAKVLLEKFSTFFEMASDWENKAKALVVTDVSQVAEMKMAREGRLFIKRKRIEIENTRKELKDQSLREGKAIDGISNVLKALLVPIEEYLEKQERFAEIQEEKAKDELEQGRKEILSKYPVLENVYDLRNMDQETFDSLVNRLEKDVEDAKKAEAERIERERKEAEERERVRKENERLRQEIEEKEKQARIERQKAEAEREAIERQAREERIKAEEQRIKAEREAREIRERIEERARETERKAIAEREALKAKQKEKEDRIRATAEKKLQEQKDRARQAEKEKKKLEKQVLKMIHCPFCHEEFSIDEAC